MWHLSTSDLIAILLLIAFLAVLCYALRLRSKMLTSKAHFAFVVSSTLAACAFALLSFLTGSGPVWIGNKILSGVEATLGIDDLPQYASQLSWFIALLGTLGTVLASYFIYRFSVDAIRNWDGPVTVNVNELAKQSRDNSLGLLALTELRRLVRMRSDPIASAIAVNWEQYQREAPPAPPWHEFARSLFEAAFDEASFNENSWRDRFNSWVGEMFVFKSGGSETSPLVLFVFDDEPDEMTLRSRIEAFERDGGSLSGSKVFAVFDGRGGEREDHVMIGYCTVEVWSRRALLLKGLKLSLYARDLIRRFEIEVLGGTNATLKDTFIEPHVHRRGTADRTALSDVLTEWISERSRRHLAITGEYGQGKSTAMLGFSAQWAKRYLRGDAAAERIPLLLELRGQSPAESDSLTFLSAWAGRYGLSPKQVYNLIRSGDAIVIFEGFDELRNAGRAYDRHEHFNALWAMAFPGTKLIFTGRPNFFLDEKEKNRTLRSDTLSGAAGGAFTQVWEMERLTLEEVSKIVRAFGESIGQSIMEPAEADPTFFEIASRPSMLPVVVTIWDTIQALRTQGHELTGAILMEYYLQATYRRKEEERDQQVGFVPQSHSYLLLPREVREVFTLSVVLTMACSDARNTISRASLNRVIAQTYDDVLMMFQKVGVPADIAQRVRTFEERFRDESKLDNIERVANDVASAGLFVSDPAGGSSNLRLPHKQFYEYLIAKGAYLNLRYRDSLTSGVLRSVSRDSPYRQLLTEEQSLAFFSQLIGSEFFVFKSALLVYTYSAINVLWALYYFLKIFFRKSKIRLFRRLKDSIAYRADEKRFLWEPDDTFNHFTLFLLAVVIPALLTLPLISDITLNQSISSGLSKSSRFFQYHQILGLGRFWARLCCHKLAA